MRKGKDMNNQYNGQSTPQQQNQQPAPQQNQQPQQPILQNPSPQYAPPPKPYVDPAIAKKRKADAIDSLGDKVAEALNANPFLTFIEKNSVMFSYIATGVSALFTLVAMTLANFTLVFALIAVIFGFFALSKKKVLPLALALSVLTLFSLIAAIGSIVMVAQMGDLVRIASYVSSDNPLAGYVVGGILVIIFGFIETLAVGFLTYCAWDYHMALNSVRAPMQQQYYNNQPMQQNAPVQQAPVNSQPVQQAAPAPAPQTAPAPVPQPVQQTAPVQQPAPAVKYCSSCGTQNNGDALFCKSCGKKFK